MPCFEIQSKSFSAAKPADRDSLVLGSLVVFGASSNPSLRPLKSTFVKSFYVSASRYHSFIVVLKRKALRA